jgi:hypothetical protein
MGFHISRQRAKGTVLLAFAGLATVRDQKIIEK